MAADQELCFVVDPQRDGIESDKRMGVTTSAMQPQSGRDSAWHAH